MNIETILIVTIVLLIGIGIGFFIGRKSMTKTVEHSAEIEAELWKTKQDTDEYRHQVNHHFEKTAELVGKLTNSYKDMTQHYKKVYEHLAQGAQTLASVDTSKMITASTIDQLIYEANEDTHVAEKSSKTSAKAIAEQPKQKALDTTETTTAPAIDKTLAEKGKPEKPNKKKPEKNAAKGDENPAKKGSATEVKPEKPAKNLEPLDLTSTGEKKETPPEQKKSGKK